MTIILAAGGTGGHIFPAESLAETLLAKGEQVAMMTDARFGGYYAKGDKSALSRIPIHTIRATKLGSGLVGKAVGAVGVAFSIARAWNMLRTLRPKAVIGFGGYPSFPTVMAASLLRIPTLIHEQNAVLGRANRVLAGRVGRIAATYESMQHLPLGCEEKVTLTGNPVRGSIAALAQMPYPALEPDGMLRLLVTGGSQGANVFSDVVPAAIALLHEHLRTRLRIDQQCRPDRIDAVRETYAAIGVQADLGTFFTDIPARLAAAHLVIGRSGASTVAELTVAGRPAILVPYPAATDDHQFYNAQAIAETGAGWVLRQEAFTPEALCARLESFLAAPDLLAHAAAQMRAQGKPDAAARLAQLVVGQ